MISCTPTFIEALPDFPEAAAVLPRMSSFDIGAEAFPTSLYERLRAAGINGVIYNSYGMTETTITATSAVMINCAENVKHFSKGDDIERVIYLGVKNLIAYCKASGAGLIQISTVSVGGMTMSENPPLLSENMLFCGQKQISKYTQSKYLAERDVLEAAADGLFAKTKFRKHA